MRLLVDILYLRVRLRHVERRGQRDEYLLVAVLTRPVCGRSRCRLVERRRHGAVVWHVEAGERFVGHGRRGVDILLAERVVCAVGHGLRFAVYGIGAQHRYLHAAFVVEVHKRYGARLGERLAYGGLHDLYYDLAVGELDGRFLRMYVDVDALGIDRQVEKVRRHAALGYEFVVCAAYGFVQLRRLEITSVDEQVLFRVALLGGCRAADESAQGYDRSRDGHIEQVLFYVPSDQIDDAACAVGRGQAEQRRVVRQKLELDLGVAQRYARELLLHLRAETRVVALDELATRGDVVE